MINYLDEISKLITHIKPHVHIEIIDKLYYSKYAFYSSSKFDIFNQNLTSYSVNLMGRSKIISTTKDNIKLLESIYGKNWENCENINLEKKYKPEDFSKFIKNLEFLQDMKFQNKLLLPYGPLVTIKIPKDSNHLQELIHLQDKTNNTKSFTKIKYMSGKPKDSNYPVKSTITMDGTGLSKDEIDFLVETFETTDGIKMNTSTLREKLGRKWKGKSWPISRTVYAKSVDCFNHLIFMLKPYNIKFLKTEVYE
jgi:hypothetical protein